MANFNPICYQHGRAMLLGGIRQTHSFAEVDTGIPEQWRQFRALGRIPGQLGATSYGVICGANAIGIEYMCAVEVESFDGLSSAWGRMRISPQRYAVFMHQGHVSSLRCSWERIWNEWLPNTRCKIIHAPDFERYAEPFDPSTGLGAVEIWIPIAEPNRRTTDLTTKTISS